MNQPMTLREEQESAIREAAKKLAERFNQAFNFDQKKFEDFISKGDRPPRQQLTSKNL
ncbi:hypothetical protein [Mesorhizobium sp. WSM3860]|uniref:hypothetical protein n=1 Tax=Mesorhizobium sp. WSM3860 TaxID=2029403 RepID=UPI00159673A3|nr:hypothetical protein [Mesorhizobium sp. WSM3860]